MSELSHACPSPADLLIYMEEPDAAIRDHISGCANCRHLLAELSEADTYLSEYRYSFERRAPGPPSVAALQARLRTESARNSFAQRAAAFLRWPRAAAFAVAAAACVILAIHSRDVWNPASVEAAEVLKNATAHPRHSSRVVVRQAGRILADTDTTKLQLARINSVDPLNANDFAQWREEQGRKRDTVTHGDGWIRLSTAVLGGGSIDSASITVNSRDWRPFARTVHFRGEDEIEFEAVADPPEGSRTASVATPSNSPVASPDASVPKPTRSHELALRLWEALHATGADVLDSARLRSQDGGVCYELWSSTERRHVVMRAMGNIPGAQQCTQQGTPERRVRVLDPLLANRTAASPFYAALVKHFGSEERVDRYMDEVVQRYAALLARVTALERYLQWYTPAVVESLDPTETKRVEAIAHDHVADVRVKGAAYLRTISEALAAVRSTQDLPAPSTSDAAVQCGSPRAASSLADDLRLSQREFLELSAAPGDYNALLDRTLRARSTLARRLNELCDPKL